MRNKSWLKSSHLLTKHRRCVLQVREGLRAKWIKFYRPVLPSSLFLPFTFFWYWFFSRWYFYVFVCVLVCGLHTCVYRCVHMCMGVYMCVWVCTCVYSCIHMCMACTYVHQARDWYRVSSLIMLHLVFWNASSLHLEHILTALTCWRAPYPFLLVLGLQAHAAMSAVGIIAGDSFSEPHA